MLSARYCNWPLKAKKKVSSNDKSNVAEQWRGAGWPVGGHGTDNVGKVAGSSAATLPMPNREGCDGASGQGMGQLTLR